VKGAARWHWNPDIGHREPDKGGVAGADRGTMSTFVVTRGGELGRRSWIGFLLVGIVLVLCGLFAMLSPTVSTLAASLVMGLVLAVSGVARIIQSFQARGSGFYWLLLTGAVELVGGVLVYFNPLQGAIALTLLIAIVFLAEGVAQFGLAFRLRSQPGWLWLALSAVIALAAGAMLALRLPMSGLTTPGTLVGVTLFLAGCCYIAIALTLRRAFA
jgi:uncharacterized membrane protein HdeD (DUF308 family)